MSKKTRAMIQAVINEECMDVLDTMIKEWFSNPIKYVRRLRYCKAWVYENSMWYVLKSYNTIVAMIDKNSDVLYDFSRYVYGYTATTSQHIRKFERDYCQQYFGCKRVVTYRPI